MNASCQPIPRAVANEMLQLVARAVCVFPGEQAPQRHSRTRQLVYTTMGFSPRDGLEYMLSSLTVGHFHLILDSMRDTLHGQMDEMKGRTKTTLVALDRALLGILKEMRLAQRRPLAWVAQQEAVTDAPDTDWIAEWAGMPEEPAAAEAGTPAAAEQAPEAEVEAEAEPLAAVEASVTAAAPDETAQPALVTTPAASWADQAEPAGPRSALPPAAPPFVASWPAQGGGGPAPVSRFGADDDALVERHIAEFQEAFAATAETLAEARALDAVIPEPVVASGD